MITMIKRRTRHKRWDQACHNLRTHSSGLITPGNQGRATSRWRWTTPAFEHGRRPGTSKDCNQRTQPKTRPSTQVLDLLAEASSRNVYAGKLEVRPPPGHRARSSVSGRDAAMVEDLEPALWECRRNLDGGRPETRL